VRIMPLWIMLESESANFHGIRTSIKSWKNAKKELLILCFFGVVYDALYCVVLKTNTLFCYLASRSLASLYALLDGHFDF
jgi:hypothetical protein